MNKPNPSSSLDRSRAGHSNGKLNSHGRNRAGRIKSSILSSDARSRADSNSSKLSSSAASNRRKGNRPTACSNSAPNRKEAADNFNGHLNSNERSEASGRSTALETGSRITAPGNSAADMTDIAFPTTDSGDTSAEAMSFESTGSPSCMRADIPAFNMEAIG